MVAVRHYLRSLRVKVERSDPWRFLLLPTAFGLAEGGVYLGGVSGGGVEDGGLVCLFFSSAGAYLWSVFPGGARMRETTLRLWNKVLRASLFFVVVCSGGGVGSVSPCTGVHLLSSLVLLLLFLMFLEAGLAAPGLWRFTPCGVGEVWVGVARSKGPTADVWLRRMCCSLPMIGVWFSIWGSVGGWSPSRCVLRAEKHRRSG